MMEDGQLSCPTCRAHHPATSATQFPISYHIETLVKKLEVLKLTYTSKERSKVLNFPSRTSAETTRQSTGISRKLRSLLEEQKNNVYSVVEGSQEVQSQLDQYRAHLADWKTQHLHLLDKLYDLVQQNKSALELLEWEDNNVLGMKTEGNEGEKQLQVVLGSLQAVNTAQEVGPTINHADHCSVEVENWMQNCQELFPDVNTIKTTMKVRENTRRALDVVTIEVGEGERTRMTLEAKGATTGTAEEGFHKADSTLSIMEKVQDTVAEEEIIVQDLRRMRPPVKRLVEAGLVFGVQKDEGSLRSSRITLEDGKIYLHCLQNQLPPPHARTLPVSEIVGVLNSSSTLVFLEMSWPGSTRGRVHIRLSPDTSLARQFVLLCTGQRGHSYLNTVLLMVVDKGEPGECVLGGDYEHNIGMGGASLLPHPQYLYRRSSSAGVVVSGFRSESNKSAQFFITTREQKEEREYGYVIGEVESGLEVVRAAANHSNIRQVTVVDCGVVVSL